MTTATPAFTLTEEQQATQRLVLVLQQEQDALAAGQPEEIAELITAKATIIATMATLAEQRHHTLAALNFDASEGGMQSWLDQNGSDTDKQIWDDLFASAQTARELNRLNGVLIGKQMSINQNALQILQGKSQTGNFYGPDGQSSMSTTSRRLGVV